MTTLSRSVIIAALALGAGSVARAQQAPATTPPPAPPKRDTVALSAPPRLAPPPRPAARAARSTGVAATPSPVTPAGRASTLTPDSTRPRGTTVAAVPADATGRCKDGTWLTGPVAPAACDAHRGFAFVTQQTAPPPRPVARAAAPLPTAQLQAAQAAGAAPPAGATMRCKDGSYLSGTADSARCANRGGVAAILPAARSAPPPARPRH